ncbi:NADH dehydrogenase subunit I [Iris pallida]|uniref:NADH dehydrogenase subunit I (Chloroplast) n=1 Tax=Iris pallida TaxID=29817 RepID=A0AAX6DNJ8_IRIPA|nr:NADH dehydrogenase subunit I [Iris pallida]KAJ6821154.1 NADH dehydrogenase subunit I [Iris pallida]KAJ6826690.1 NADH dehydrogenase subunit I [Iris pallida]
MKRKKKALANVIKIPIVIPKTPAILFIPKSSGMDIYGIDKFHPPK